MPHEFIESRRRLKRLKKLPPVTGSVIVPKKGKGNAFQHTKTGLRSDLGIILRSSWEADVCRIFTIHGIDFEFEPRVFYFPMKRGTKGYTPDFYLTKTNEWVEVKGWFDNKSRTKINRFRIYYPEEFAKLTMIISKHSKAGLEICTKLGVPNVIFFEDLKDAYKATIPNWESK